MVPARPSWRPPRSSVLAALLGSLFGIVLAAGRSAAFAALPSGPAPRAELHHGRISAGLGAAAAGPVAAAAAAPCCVAAALGVVAAAALGRYSLRQRAAAATRRHRVALSAFENELGVQDPVGFWDPAGLADDGDVMKFRRRRSVEIKHGRLSMMATMGYITPEIIGKLPGYLSPSMNIKFTDVPNGLAAISKVPAFGWLQILAYMGYVELSAGFEDYKTGTPGDYEWKILTSSDPSTREAKLNSEIANGRLAMVAIVGMFFQDGLTGSAWGDWALYTGSPLRAFENELGVQAPVGCWDPMGLSADGDVEAFQRRRATEIKHGRVSMFACMGYIAPEYFKWPGYLSPSQKLEFADVPNGLAALSKVPSAGWCQIFLFCGLVETGLYRFDPSRAPGDYENGGVLGVPNGSNLPAGETRTRKLNAELANGRLAMMAIIGMFFQDGLTGSAWGDWELYAASPLRASGE